MPPRFWMGHKPKTMSELYSRTDEEFEQRLLEAEVVAAGFVIPNKPAPECSKTSVKEEIAVAA